MKNISEWKLRDNRCREKRRTQGQRKRWENKREEKKSGKFGEVCDREEGGGGKENVKIGGSRGSGGHRDTEKEEVEVLKLTHERWVDMEEVEKAGIGTRWKWEKWRTQE